MESVECRPTEKVEKIPCARVAESKDLRCEEDSTDEREYTESEIEALAIVIYQEAGGDACCDDCRMRVADVVLNRVEDERFPDTIEEVLTAPKQYGRLYHTGLKWAERSKLTEEAEAVARAYETAEAVLNGSHSELYGEEYIWQAEFKQGTDIVECCGIYFGR